MKGTELKKQYSDILSALKKNKSKNCSVLQIIDAIEKNYKELFSVKDNELSDVDYDFYADMLNRYCKELDCIGIKYKTDTHIKTDDSDVKQPSKEKTAAADKTKIKKDSEKNTPKSNDSDVVTPKKKEKHPLLIIFVIVLTAFVLYFTNQSIEKYNLVSEAKAGIAEAQFELSLNYHSGKNGFAVDDSEAEKWMKSSAVNGYAPAQHNMGLRNESGPAKYYKEAIKWYQKAAEQGYQPSIKRLEELKETFPEYFTESNTTDESETAYMPDAPTTPDE